MPYFSKFDGPHDEVVWVDIESIVSFSAYEAPAGDDECCHLRLAGGHAFTVKATVEAVEEALIGRQIEGLQDGRRRAPRR
ncbi:hypothetical protein [Caulobacter hibisci]|uniref:Uncharacterized protein n=1 Tax=Caulobacter hibisci TaxID=2035993 RepID=A0ABS0SXT1_9CAUL|nr:hypothetical protein [Caulobacter hibisci]MBI1684447.1 hypothetical protein [Caulobacter hibisci]